MSMLNTPQLSLLPDQELPAQVDSCLKDLLSQPIQPSPSELLELLEQRVGWIARWEFQPSLERLRQDRHIPSYVRDYLTSFFEAGEVEEAIRGEAPPTHEVASTIDNLLQRSAAYRSSQAFREMMRFVARFKDYAPFNNLLVRVQNPSCRFYATAKDWKDRFSRELIDDARPMMILAPMHPVLLVYDLDQTMGPPLPEKLLALSHVEGQWDSQLLNRLLENARRLAIKVDFKTLSSVNSGFATLGREGGEWKMRIAVHDQLPPAAQFSVLCHELAHILLGHLGTDKDHWWPSRVNLTKRVVEIEAETVAFIVAERFGLHATSETYLAGYVSDAQLPAGVSIERITKVAGKLQQMAQELIPKREPKVLGPKRRGRK